MTARDGARLFAMMAAGGRLGDTRLLSEERLREYTEPRPDSDQVDGVIDMVAWIGRGGYWLGGPRENLDPTSLPALASSLNTLSQGGAGGSYGWADLDSRLGVLITHNRMFGAVTLERHPFVAIGDAVRAVAAERAQG
jgi:CubicO group peptidase (beta-lactamase class C family)